MSQLVPSDSNEEEEAHPLEDEGGSMGFLDHVEELRWTLLKPLGVFIVSFVLVMIFIADVKDLLMWPLVQTMTDEDRKAFEGLATRNMMGVYSAMFHIGLIVGVGIASPFLVYNVGRFLAPALNAKERMILVPGSIAVFILFLLGCSFSFFLLLPQAIDITIWFNAMMGFQIIWSPDSYFGFITWIVLGMGVAFQFPVVVIVLIHLNIVTVQMLRSFRRYMVMILIVAAAILTPPDPVTQVMMAVPMYLLYELSIWVAAILTARRKRKEEEEDALY
ncbi:twin-arginine translocase subunit TatC [Puniceicoccaceae bacterium K14]|nr:twin-arginine translocase subunit TatC [Puniceicoccaceae bacterium K14]